MSSDADLSSSPSPNRNPSEGLDSLSSEYDPVLEALVRESNRGVAATALMRLFVPVVLGAVVLALGTWGFVNFARARNEFRQKANEDPYRAMDMLLDATGQPGGSEDLFSGGQHLESIDFNSKDFQLPSFGSSKNR